MRRHWQLFIILVTLAIGFFGGLVLRPIIMSKGTTTVVANTRSSVSTPRGFQYFEANVDEARRVVSACREGLAVGQECANAETAIMTVNSKERFKRFRTQQ